MKSGKAPLNRFIPYPNNPRTHPQSQIVLLSELLKKRGADQPIVIDEEWVIIKGHGRRQAAILAGINEFPYVQRFGLSNAEKLAMRIEDNQTALLSGWDNALIQGEIASLKIAGYDIPMLGFPEAPSITSVAGSDDEERGFLERTCGARHQSALVRSVTFLQERRAPPDLEAENGAGEFAERHHAADAAAVARRAVRGLVVERAAGDGD